MAYFFVAAWWHGWHYEGTRRRGRPRKEVLRDDDDLFQIEDNDVIDADEDKSESSAEEESVASDSGIYRPTSAFVFLPLSVLSFFLLLFLTLSLTRFV